MSISGENKMDGIQNQVQEPITKTKNPFKIVTIILAVMVLGLGGVTAWALISKNDNKGDSTANNQTTDNSPNNEGEIDNSEKTDEESPDNQETTDDIYSLDNIASFTIPESWEIYSDTYTADKTCHEAGSSFIGEDNIRCIEGVSLIPGEKLSDFKNNNEYFKVDIKVFHNGSPYYSPFGVMEILSGEKTNEMTDSDKSINGYEAYYRRIVNKSYTDVIYIIHANPETNKRNDFIIISARTASKHYTQNGENVDDEKDFTRFESAIKQIADSVTYK
jgi:hypothetical protein